MKIWLIVVGLLILGVISYFIRNLIKNLQMHKMMEKSIFGSKENMEKLLEVALGEKRKPVKESWFRKWFLYP